jgi:hypothetical protein
MDHPEVETARQSIEKGCGPTVIVNKINLLKDD